MATTKPAAPAAKKTSSVGIKDAIWVIVICAIIAFCNFFLNFGQSEQLRRWRSRRFSSEHLGYHLQGWCYRACDPHSVAHRYLHGYRARARSEQVYR